MPRSLIALGSNLGDRAATLRRAVELVAADPSISDVAISGFHETPPIGGPADQGAYLNAAVALDTTLAPEKLHDLLRRIETELGRRPGPRWAARVIDLDLLLFGDQIIGTPTLAVPHPRMAFRRFVLAPAAEVAREMVHPLIDWTIGRLLAHLDTAGCCVALLGMPDDGRSALAGRVAGAVGGTYLAVPAEFAFTGTRADPSGHAQRRQIQFLDRAARLLGSRDWHAARNVAISDFYFDECLAYARINLDEPEYERFREAWAAKRETLVAPKLLVVLDAWEQGLRARSGATQLPRDAEPADRLRLELLRLAARSDQGPVLYAGRDDPQAQFDEITAAIAAMT
jgi:2-amino-4-hydroxy-6-hydroxymethyldihydropteridine diphosphokinase